MKRWYLLGILFSVALGVTQSHAGWEEKAFGLQEKSLEWKRLQVEEYLEQKLTEDISRYVPQALFSVYIDVTFRGQVRARKTSNVTLSKLGVVGGTYTRDPIRPRQGLFGRISAVYPTLVVDTDLPPRTIASMEEIIRKRIPVVAGKRIKKIQVLRMARPGMGVGGWVREFKTIIGMLLIMGLFCFTLVHLFGKIRVQSTWNTMPVATPDRGESKKWSWGQLLPAMTPLEQWTGKNVDDEPTPILPVGQVAENLQYAESEVDPVAPNTPVASRPADEFPSDPAFSLLPRTVAALELKKIRSAFMTLTLQECVAIAEKDTKLASVMEMLLPSEKAQKIFALLPDYRRKEIISENLKWNEAAVIKNSGNLIKKIHEYKGVHPKQKSQSVSNLVTYVNQVGPQGEQEIYDNLVASNKSDVLAELVYKNTPADLCLYVPKDVLRSCLMRMHFQDRVELIAYCEQEVRDLFFNAVGEHDTKTKMVLEVEVKKVMGQMDPLTRSENLHHLWSKFVKIVREAVSASPRLQTDMVSHVDQWLWKQTKGLVGKNGKKTA